MQKLIIVLAALGAACATPTPGNPIGNLVNGAKTLAEGAVHVVETGVGVAADTIDATLGLNHGGQNAVVYYANMGIIFVPSVGYCTCPPGAVIPPGYPGYTPFFSTIGVVRLPTIPFCTCPEQLRHLAEAHHGAGPLGTF